jgi:hypothetical protein
MREFSISAYGRLARAVDVPLLVAETSDGAHMNSADFIAAGAATFGVRASTTLRGGITGAMRTAHLADAYRLRAEVHGSDIPNQHLCMAISNTTYYESLVTSVRSARAPAVDANGLVHAPPGRASPCPPGSTTRPRSRPTSSNPHIRKGKTMNRSYLSRMTAASISARPSSSWPGVPAPPRAPASATASAFKPAGPGRELRDHRLDRLHPAGCGEGVPEGQPRREDGHRHVRRQRRRVDLPADQGAAVRPYG